MSESGLPSDLAGDLAILQSENAALQAQLQEVLQISEARLVQAELKAEAIRAGMVDLDGLKLIAPGALSIGADGNVVGAAGVIDKLKRDKAWLFHTGSSSSSAQPPASVPVRAKLATEMTLDEWRTARADLLRRR
jgi:hypothetical protein